MSYPREMRRTIAESGDQVGNTAELEICGKVPTTAKPLGVGDLGAYFPATVYLSSQTVDKS